MKKIFAAMLALLMIATLCACSEDNKNKVDLNKYKQEEVVIEYVEVETKDAAGNLLYTEKFYFETLDTESVAITGYTGPDKAHTLYIPKELDVSDPSDTTKTDIRSVTTIASEAFYYCSKINAIEFPETVTTIENYAFAGCALITSLDIPANVTTIGDGAFFGCTALSSLTFAEGSKLESIGKYAFADCVAVPTVSLPASLKSIDDGAFKDCEALTSVTIAEGAETIGKGAFISCKKLANLTLPASLTSIGSFAFSESEELYANGVAAPEGSYAAAYVEAMNLDDAPIVAGGEEA